MRIIKPDCRFDLPHRAHFLRGYRGSSVFMAASPDGQVSFVDMTLKTAQVSQAMRVTAICPHPSKPFTAWVDGSSGTLIVQNLAASRLVEIQPPQLFPSTSNATKRGFTDCYFDESGEALWLIAPLNADEAELSLVETEGWSVINKKVLQDPFGASDWSFHGTGRLDLTSLWIAAGQDGQQVRWLNRSGNTFSVEQADELVNCIPPAFSPDGSEFLVLAEDNTVRKYGFATMKEIGQPVDSGNEDNPFAESLCYLDSGHALASTGEGRTFLIDVRRMAVVDEVAINGHEPRPIGEYFPALAKESGWATDISWFARVGDTIVFVYNRERGTASYDQKLWMKTRQ
jgi:WD40 repeat protein